MPLKVTDQTDGGPIFIRGGEIELIHAQTVRIVLWIDLPTTGERRIVARIAVPLPSPLTRNPENATGARRYYQ